MLSSSLLLSPRFFRRALTFPPSLSLNPVQSEGQYEEVGSKEIKSIRDACAAIDPSSSSPFSLPLLKSVSSSPLTSTSIFSFFRLPTKAHLHHLRKEVRSLSSTSLDAQRLLWKRGCTDSVCFLYLLRHHIRFFGGPNDVDKSGNLPAGTVVDRSVTHPFA